MRALAFVAATWIFLGSFPVFAGECTERPTIPSLDPKNKFADYSAAARRRDLQGALRVEFSIDKHGRIADAKIVDDPAGMRYEALKGLSAVRFIVPSAWKASSCRYSMRLVYRLYSIREPAPQIGDDPTVDVTVTSTATSIPRT